MMLWNTICLVLLLVNFERSSSQRWEVRKSIGGDSYSPKVFAISKKDHAAAFISSEYCMRGNSVHGFNRATCTECGDACTWKSRAGFENEAQWQAAVTLETAQRMSSKHEEQVGVWVLEAAPEALLLGTGGLEASLRDVSLDNVVVSGTGAVYYVVTCYPAMIRKMQVAGFSTATALPYAMKIHPLVAEAITGASEELGREGITTLELKVSLSPSISRGSGDGAADVNALSSSLTSMVVSSVGHPRVQVKAQGKDDLSVEGLANKHEVAAAAEVIARNPYTLWVDPNFILTASVDLARGIVQSFDPFQTPMYDIGLTGKGQIIGIADSGLDYSHCLFRDEDVPVEFTDGRFESSTHRKLVQYIAYVDELEGVFSGHGTHVAATAVGSVANSKNDVYRGIASDAKIAFFDLGEANVEKVTMQTPSSVHDTIFLEAYRAGARIHSNSYGSNKPWYTTRARMVDIFTWRHQDFLILYAASNSGRFSYSEEFDDDSLSSLPEGYGTVAAPSVAKNCVSVGATGNWDDKDMLASFSGRGPTEDGRIKPDVLAPGNVIVSAQSKAFGDPSEGSCDVTAKAGTSMSAPVVAGAAALVRQYFTDGYYPDGLKPEEEGEEEGFPTTGRGGGGFTPMAALLKVVLVNSGRPMSDFDPECSKAGGETLLPNIDQGWGAVSLADTLVTPDSPNEQRLYAQGHWSERCGDCAKLAHGDSHSYKIKMAVAPSSLPLKVTMVFYDYDGTVYARSPVVNNVDMKVTGPSGDDILPNRRTASDGPDEINSVEHIRIPSPQPGQEYVVTIEGTRVQVGPQPYALVISGAFDSVEDDDFDGDGFNSVVDTCPAVSNPDQNPEACSSFDPPASCGAPFPRYLGDGVCDNEEYNNEDCGWDGGDCCSTSCGGGAQQQEEEGGGLYSKCGIYGYNCQDPVYEDDEEAWDPTTTPVCDVPREQLGDGWCDDASNVVGCHYDFGDCCESLCEGEGCTSQLDAGHAFNCRVPDLVVPNCALAAADEPRRLGDGVCDPAGLFNTEECGWDLGDCCPETCFDGGGREPATRCGSTEFECKQPGYDPVCAAGYVGPDCDVEIRCSGNQCFYIGAVVTGDEAETYCEGNFGEGWSLACPTTSDEISEITKLMATHTTPPVLASWLGYSANNNNIDPAAGQSSATGDDDFSCVSTGEPMGSGYYSWGKKGNVEEEQILPSSPSSQYCVEIQASTGGFGTVACSSSSRPVVCQHVEDLRVVRPARCDSKNSSGGDWWDNFFHQSLLVKAAGIGGLVLISLAALVWGGRVCSRRRHHRGGGGPLLDGSSDSGWSKTNPMWWPLNK